MRTSRATSTSCSSTRRRGCSRVPGLRMIGTAPEKAGVMSFVLDGAAPRTSAGARPGGHRGALRPPLRAADPAPLRPRGTVRASLALYNTREDIDALVAALQAHPDRSWQARPFSWAKGSPVLHVDDARAATRPSDSGLRGAMKPTMNNAFSPSSLRRVKIGQQRRDCRCHNNRSANHEKHIALVFRGRGIGHRPCERQPHKLPPQVALPRTRNQAWSNAWAGMVIVAGTATAAGGIAIAMGTGATGAGTGGDGVIITTGDGAAIAVTTTIVATIASAGGANGARTSQLASSTNGRHSR